MRTDPDRPIPATGIEAGLERLGVRELEERMELSPLLADGGVGDTDNCECTCRCDNTMPEEIDIPILYGDLKPEEITRGF